jgi:hypothetical protein
MVIALLQRQQRLVVQRKVVERANDRVMVTLVVVATKVGIIRRLRVSLLKALIICIRGFAPASLRDRRESECEKTAFGRHNDLELAI